MGCGMECGTLCDVRVWAVAWNVERCAMCNEVRVWHGMWNVV